MARRNSAADEGIGGALADLGFRRARNGDFRRGKLTLSLDGWANLADRRRNLPAADALEGELGRPGLWKRVVQGKAATRVLELPPDVLTPIHDHTGESDDESPPLLACLRWALATLDGAEPTGWTAPPLDEVEQWYEKQQLIVRQEQCVRQISIVRSADKLALSAPIAPSVPVDLPAERMSWLREVMRETQDRWRMVRVGLVDGSADSSPAAVAEVDLTGAPAAAVESLFVTGLESLRCAVQWSCQSADLLADQRVTCHAWEVRQPQP
ncbi:MAG: hypothetical protein QGG36_09640 [Pirellulaceae bacterium]|jgi:hypothetical protein|nr:hypothetical protein [Pirellulaceae bacterium]